MTSITLPALRAFLFGAAFMFGPVGFASAAEDLGVVKARMEQRLPQIDELKSKGVVGENSRVDYSTLQKSQMFYIHRRIVPVIISRHTCGLHETYFLVVTQGFNRQSTLSGGLTNIHIRSFK